MPNKKILFIDDDPDDREFFELALSNITANIDYSAHSSATEALRALQSNAPGPDLIFLDINMPMMDGREFLTRIKSIDSLKHIPVIMFSTASDWDTIKESIGLGAASFITKPTRLETLIDLLRPIVHPEKN